MKVWSIYCNLSFSDEEQIPIDAGDDARDDLYG